MIARQAGTIPLDHTLPTDSYNNAIVYNWFHAVCFAFFKWLYFALYDHNYLLISEYNFNSDFTSAVL